MDPIVFHASVKSFRSDEIGECTLTFKVPDCDKTQAHHIGGLTGEGLMVTVIREKDVQDHLRTKGVRHVPITQPVAPRKRQPIQRTR